MTPREMESLGFGDRVWYERDRETHTVLANYGNHVPVMRHINVTSPTEWRKGGNFLTDIRTLSPGDVIVNAPLGDQYVVIGVDVPTRSATAAAARVITADSCHEWKLTIKAEFRPA